MLFLQGHFIRPFSRFIRGCVVSLSYGLHHVDGMGGGGR